MPSVQLSESVAFNTVKFLRSLPKEKLVKVDGSDFKSITMKRKIATLLEDANKPYAEKLLKLDELLKKAQEEVRQFNADLENTEGEEAAKKAEQDVYIASINEKLAKDLEELGRAITVVKQDSEGKPAGSLVMLVSDVPVSVELEDRHLAFLKEQLTVSGVEAYDLEDDFLAAGKAFGLEE